MDRPARQRFNSMIGKTSYPIPSRNHNSVQYCSQGTPIQVVHIAEYHCPIYELPNYETRLDVHEVEGSLQIFCETGVFRVISEKNTRIQCNMNKKIFKTLKK